MLRSMTTDIDKDGCRVKNLLKDVNKEELKRLFEELGLSNATLTNRYSDSAVAYLDDLVRAWIALGKDAVLDKGGATWESLKKALQRLGQHGIVVNITPSTAGKLQNNYFKLCIFVYALLTLHIHCHSITNVCSDQFPTQLIPRFLTYH